MKRIIFSILFITVFSIFSFAQKNLTGKVIDAITGKTIVGATIASADKNVSPSDNNGNFSVNCNKISYIIVSHVGYETKRIAIKNCDEALTVSLNPVDGTLDEVEVTATSNKNKALLFQPSSITKLSPVELKRGTGLFLTDVINGNVPGVTMQSRSVAGGQEFNIRGYGNGSGGTGRINSNFDGQGYKVYLNGIPITDAEGITVMDDIDFGSVGNVEITKGPAGTLYGLTTAGVVNLTTVKPAPGKISIGQDVLFGSYGLRRFTTHFQLGGEKSSLLVNYGHQYSDGYTVHNTSTKDFVNFAANFKPNEKQIIDVFFGYSHSYDQRSGELTMAQFAAQDYSGNIEYIKRNGHSELYSFRAGATHTYNFSKNISNSTTLFGSGISNNSSSAAGWTDKEPINIGFRTTFNTNFNLKNGITLSGITGAEYQRQVAQTLGYGMIDPQGTAHAAIWKLGDPYFIIGSAATGSSGLTSNKYTTTGTTSLFTEWTLALPHDLSFTAGVGISNMLIDLNDRFYVATNTAPTKFDTSYIALVSPHFAINKVFNKHFSVYASYSKGYKAPTSSYFYIPFVTTAPGTTGIINHGLLPEIGNQFEIGTKGSTANDKLNYQFAYFDAIFSNKMTAINVLNTAGTTTLYTYVANGGKQNDMGFEALLKYTAYRSNTGFIKEIKPFVNFTISNFKYQDYTFHYKGTILKDSVVNYDGKNVAGVSKFVGNFGIDITANNGLYFSTIYSYKDGFAITSDNLNNTTSYSLWNAKLGFRHSLSRHFDIDAFFGINDITNTRYPIMVFINQIPDAYMAGPTKANYIGGINFKYNF